MKLLSLSLIFSFPIFSQWSIVRVQRDWRAGPGLVDTTDHWNMRFYSSYGINYSSTPLYLLADSAATRYDAWLRHTLISSPDVPRYAFCVFSANIGGSAGKDIVANIGDIESGAGRVIYFQYITNWVYWPQTIASYTVAGTFYRHTAAFPVDIDRDRDIDIVAGGINERYLYWYSNPTWTPNVIYNAGATGLQVYNIDVADADGDGNYDILTVERFSNNYMIVVYWGPFWTRNVLHTLVGSPGGRFWRAMFIDLDENGLLDVAYVAREGYPAAAGDPDSSAIYTAFQAIAGMYSLPVPHGWVYRLIYYDGMWHNDFDADGDMDIVAATQTNDVDTFGHFMLFRNDAGSALTQILLFNDYGNDYGDGATMHDMDGDGRMDIVGVNKEVGYFRRTGPGYGGFTLYWIDNIPDATGAHWVYPDNLDEGTCSGDQDIDLIVTYNDNIVLYENRMLSFVRTGRLFSTVISISLPIDTCVVCSLFWDGCRISGYELVVNGRVGRTMAECTTAAWTGNLRIPYYESNLGVPIGSFAPATDSIYVQYYIDVARLGDSTNISPSVDSVWVKISPIRCSCDTIHAMWICPDCWKFTACRGQIAVLSMWVRLGPIDTTKIYFTIDDGFGHIYHISERTNPGNIQYVCSDPSCDSLIVIISGFTWLNGATVTVSLDSAYIFPDCVTRW